MIAWGSQYDRGTLNTRARYDPALNAWTAVAQSDAPSARFTIPVRTGAQMIIWEGQTGLEEINLTSANATIRPLTTWTSMKTSSAPSGRHGHVASAGNVMVIWGKHADKPYLVATGDSQWNVNYFSDLAQDGGQYNPTIYRWGAVRTNAAPSPRSQSAAVGSAQK